MQLSLLRQWLPQGKSPHPRGAAIAKEVAIGANGATRAKRGMERASFVYIAGTLAAACLRKGRAFPMHIRFDTSNWSHTNTLAVDLLPLIVILGVSGLVKPRHDRHRLVIPLPIRQFTVGSDVMTMSMTPLCQTIGARQSANKDR